MRTWMLAVPMALCACTGYDGRDMQSVGQIKTVMHNTPIFCPEFVDADLSLGVMRGGVGSMSTQDMWITLPSEDQQKVAKAAQVSGKLVKVTYDRKRFALCANLSIASTVEVFND